MSLSFFQHIAGYNYVRAQSQHVVITASPSRRIFYGDFVYLPHNVRALGMSQETITAPPGIPGRLCTVEHMVRMGSVISDTAKSCPLWQVLPLHVEAAVRVLFNAQ